MSDIVTLNGYKIKDEKAVRSYETVALMKADTKLKEGYHVKTKGYYEANDGGHGEYIIVDDDTLVDDGGLIHVLTNGLRAKLIISDTIYPEQMGAKGDGTTDDTSAITKAINTEKTVHLNKNYKLTSLNISNKKLDIKCTGKITGNVLNFSGCTGYVEINADSTGSDNFVTFTNCDEITIRGTYKNAPRNAVIVSDCNNADVSVNIYAFLKAQKTGKA